VTQYPQSGIPGPGPAYGQYPAPGYGQPPAPPSERPRALVIAVWLMYAAAAFEVGYAAAEGHWIASWVSSVFTAVEAADAAAGSGSQVPASEIKNVVLVCAIVVGIVAALIWLWLAWKNGTGRKWARIVSTVLFALSCLSLPELLTGGHLSTMPSTFPVANGGVVSVPPPDIPSWVTAAGAVNWLLGLAIIILLWQRDSNRYYDAVSWSRRKPAYNPYAAPGYGGPGYGGPGYGAPGSGAPGYGAPGYGAPGYGAPGYAPPGYGQPGYAPPPGFAPPGTPQTQPYGQPPAEPQDRQEPQDRPDPQDRQEPQDPPRFPWP
jgi:hypothetical protein